MATKRHVAVAHGDGPDSWYDVDLCIAPDGPVAVLSVGTTDGQSASAVLTVDHLRQLIEDARTVESELLWHAATWFYARSSAVGETCHLQAKDAYGHALPAACGAAPSTDARPWATWTMAPCPGKPWHRSLCVACMREWQQHQERAADEAASRRARVASAGQ